MQVTFDKTREILNYRNTAFLSRVGSGRSEGTIKGTATESRTTIKLMKKLSLCHF